jgi:hypothetical protein
LRRLSPTLHFLMFTLSNPCHKHPSEKPPLKWDNCPYNLPHHQSLQLPPDLNPKLNLGIDIDTDN